MSLERLLNCFPKFHNWEASGHMYCVRGINYSKTFLSASSMACTLQLI